MSQDRGTLSQPLSGAHGIALKEASRGDVGIARTPQHLTAQSPLNSATELFIIDLPSDQVQILALSKYCLVLVSHKILI